MSLLKDKILDFFWVIFGLAAFIFVIFLLSIFNSPWSWYRFIDDFFSNEKEVVNTQQAEEVKGKQISIWKNYAASNWIFSVDLPNEPKVERTSEYGIENIRYFIIGNNLSAFYTIDYTKLPEETFWPISIQETASNYRAEQKNIIIEKDEFNNQTWIAKGRIMMNEEAAEESKSIKWSKNAYVEVKISVIWTTIYTQQVIYDPNIERSNIDRFFDSFNIKL